MLPAPAVFGGLPGGMEIAVIVANVVLLAAVAYALLVFVRKASGRGELEDRVANLEGQVAALREDRREPDGAAGAHRDADSDGADGDGDR